jgi:hypothetical protein
MNSAEYVNQRIQALKSEGIPLSRLSWLAALLCVAWAYVYGARGENCTPANRRVRYEATKAGKDKDNIKDKCKNFDGTGTCSGCKWYPDNKRTKFFDCRGFTYWILLQVFGWKLNGVGCTRQWNNESNWKAKGEVADGIPQDVIVCLFYYKKDKSGKRTSTLEHTGLYYNGETCECSNGVQYSSTLNKKWEVWAVPKCVDGDIPTPTPPEPTKPTLRKGSRGEYVILLQTELTNRGYSCGSSGVDGIFGNGTLAAVKAFQNDHGLTADGIVGPKTWSALEGSEPTVFYTVTIPHLTQEVANQLLTSYPGSEITKE